jgi:hypothetical protein
MCDGREIMNLDEIIAAADALPQDDREKLKAYLSQQELSEPQTVDEWMAELKSIADEFRTIATEEEIDAVIEAINIKSPPSEKGL